VRAPLRAAPRPRHPHRTPPKALLAPSPGLPRHYAPRRYPTPRRTLPTGPSAVSASVSAYEGRGRTTASCDDAFAPKHEATLLLKAAVLPCVRTPRIVPGSAAGPPWVPLHRNPACGRFHHPSDVPEPPLAPTQATLVAGCATLHRASPEQGAQRLAAVAAAMRPRRCCHRCNLGRNRCHR
jgi:hypothetical protein